MGWAGWALAGLALVAGIGLVTLKVAIDRAPAAVLNATDALFAPRDAVRLAAATRYGADPAQRLELWLPENAKGPLPVVVFIHGGAWDSGAPEQYRFIARTLAPHGYAVVLAGYRLYPQARFPMMLEDGAGALRWLAAHGAALRADPARVVLMGHSAGAYNAMMLTLNRQWLAGTGIAVRGAIGLAGPYDFLPFDEPASIHSFGAAPDPKATQPVHFARRDAPPLLLLHGDADTRVKPRNAVALAAAMRRVGAPVEELHLAGVDHGRIVQLLAHPFLRDRQVLDPVLAFLARVTAPSAAVQRPAS